MSSSRWAGLLSALALAALTLTVVRMRAVSGLSSGFCGQAAAAFCERYAACGGISSAQQPRCVAWYARACEGDLGWRVRHRGVLLDSEAREECLEAIGQAHCNAVAFVMGDDEPNIFEVTDRCEMSELIRPAAAVGDLCGASPDCLEGFCDPVSQGCRTCRPWRAKGAPCRDGDECRDHVCHGRCGAAAPGPCTGSDDCAPGDRCARDGGGARCVARVKTGEPCSGDEPGLCAEREAHCVEGRCQVRPFAVPKGRRCGDFTDCRPGLYCRWDDEARSNGVCTRQSAAREACRAIDYGACQVDSLCVAGSCRARTQEDEPCGGLFQCRAFLDCVPNRLDAGFRHGGTCRAAGELGASCDAYHTCWRGLCEGASATCQPLAVPGSSCAVNEQCESNWCEPASDGGVKRCRASCGHSSADES